MMGGMPPGAGTAGPGGPMPNAHALSHLNPTQAHMFQQQAFQQNCESCISSCRSSGPEMNARGCPCGYMSITRSSRQP